jgi:hypothetical protein
MPGCHKLIDNNMRRLKLRGAENARRTGCRRGGKKITSLRSYKNFEAVDLAGDREVHETWNLGMNRTGVKKESTLYINSSKSDSR